VAPKQRSVRRPFHRGLDRNAVLDAAIAVLDDEGRAALTMRGVARRLDVEAASLYTHVRSKDDLVDGVLDRVLEGIAVPALDPDWRRALTEGLTAYRRTLVAHPAVVGLMAERARATQAQLRLVERSIQLLESAGFTTAQAVEAHVTLVAYILGFVAQEVGRSADLPMEIVAASEVLPRTFAALLARTVDERFRAGLDLVLDGATARLERDGRS
jgi:AcrR family transcriptional regulator